MKVFAYYLDVQDSLMMSSSSSSLNLSGHQRVGPLCLRSSQCSGCAPKTQVVSDKHGSFARSSPAGMCALMSPQYLSCELNAQNPCHGGNQNTNSNQVAEASIHSGKNSPGTRSRLRNTEAFAVYDLQGAN